jgi:hypothetical protein
MTALTSLLGVLLAGVASVVVLRAGTYLPLGAVAVTLGLAALARAALAWRGRRILH